MLNKRGLKIELCDTPNTISCQKLYESFTRTLCFLFIINIDCDGVVLEIYSDPKFQQPQEGLSCESLAYKVVT